MNRFTWVAASIATGCLLAFGVNCAGADDTVYSSAWGPNVSLPTQATLDESREKRTIPLHSVSIEKRPGHLPWGRQRVRAANELPVERRADSKLTAKDIRSSGSYSGYEKFSIAAFTRPLPVVAEASPVEVRAITPAAYSTNRLVMARNAAYSESPEALGETLRTAANVVSVDVRKPTKAKAVRRVTPDAATDTAVTIVGRPGEKVHEVSGGGVLVDDEVAPELNTMSPEAIARQAAARDERDAKNQALKEQREEELQGEAAPETGNADADAVAEAPPAPPGPREVETERRYDWRKGLYVRVPKDAPPVPAPGIVVAPADRFDNGEAAKLDAPLRGKVPRRPKPVEEPKAEAPAVQAAPEQ